MPVQYANRLSSRPRFLGKVKTNVQTEFANYSPMTIWGGGSIVFNGTATTRADYQYIGAGGIVFAGSAATTANDTYQYAGSGQLVFAGQATEQATYIKAGSGGVVFDSQADFDIIYNGGFNSGFSNGFAIYQEFAHAH
jgi:hypothetical protein